jgi:hypothetical protein
MRSWLHYIYQFAMRLRFNHVHEDIATSKISYDS